MDENLLEFIHLGVLPKSINEENRTVANFLTFIAFQIDSLDEISYGILVVHYRQDNYKTQTTNQVYTVATADFCSLWKRSN